VILLAPGRYRVSLHYLERGVLDFTVMDSGERHAIHLFKNQLLLLNIALICQKGITIDNPAGGQVFLTVIVKTNGDQAFNRIGRIEAVDKVLPFETSVPTPAMLATLPVLDFEDIACS